MTWGVGSRGSRSFYNGVTLGAVAADYAQAGYVPFLPRLAGCRTA